MSSTNATQDSGKPAASGGGAAGGTPAADASAKGAAGAGAGSADGKKTSLIEDAAGGDAGKGGNDGKGAEGQGQKDAAAKAAGAEGELVLKLPEGAQVPKEYVEQFTAALKGVEGITPEIGNKLIALDLKRQTDATENAVKAWETINDGWVDEITKDKEFGGDKLPVTKANLARALAKYPDGKQVAKDLVEHGVQNIPSLVRLIARYGAAMSEDTSGGTKGGNPATATTHEEKLAKRYNKVKR